MHKRSSSSTKGADYVLSLRQWRGRFENLTFLGYMTLTRARICFSLYPINVVVDAWIVCFDIVKPNMVMLMTIYVLGHFFQIVLSLSDCLHENKRWHFNYFFGSGQLFLSDVMCNPDFIYLARSFILLCSSPVYILSCILVA